jgi:hypothetical protein
VHRAGDEVEREVAGAWRWWLSSREYRSRMGDSNEPVGELYAATAAQMTQMTDRPHLSSVVRYPRTCHHTTFGQNTHRPSRCMWNPVRNLFLRCFLFTEAFILLAYFQLPQKTRTTRLTSSMCSGRSEGLPKGSRRYSPRNRSEICSESRRRDGQNGQSSAVDGYMHSFLEKDGTSVATSEIPFRLLVECASPVHAAWI